MKDNSIEWNKNLPKIKIESEVIRENCNNWYEEGLKDKEKEMLDKIELYFVYTLLNKKVPKLEELKQRLKDNNGK